MHGGAGDQLLLLLLLARALWSCCSACSISKCACAAWCSAVCTIGSAIQVHSAGGLAFNMQLVLQEAS